MCLVRFKEQENGFEGMQEDKPPKKGWGQIQNASEFADLANKIQNIQFNLNFTQKKVILIGSSYSEEITCCISEKKSPFLYMKFKLKWVSCVLSDNPMFKCQGEAVGLNFQ